jgi:hypothetical protein
MVIKTAVIAGVDPRRRCSILVHSRGHDLKDTLAGIGQTTPQLRLSTSLAGLGAFAADAVQILAPQAIDVAILAWLAAVTFDLAEPAAVAHLATLRLIPSAGHFETPGAVDRT